MNDKNISKDNYVLFGDHSEHIKFVDFAFVQGADGLKILKCDESKIIAKLKSPERIKQIAEDDLGMIVPKKMYFSHER